MSEPCIKIFVTKNLSGTDVFIILKLFSYFFPRSRKYEGEMKIEFASLMELESSLINPAPMYTMALNRVI